MLSGGAKFCARIFGSTAFFFCAKHLIMWSKLSYFAVEGTHWKLKRMLCSRKGLSLVRERLLVQMVVGNHTMNASLVAHGCDTTRRAQRGQRFSSVQRYVGCTRKLSPTNMHYLSTLLREI